MRSLESYRKECAEAGDNVVIFFDQLIDDGQSPSMASMLAFQQPPGTKGTDRAFLEGSHEWANRIAPVNRKYIFEAAKKAGISTQGKVYKSGLGKASDPMAWVSDSSDVIRACKAKGYSVEGAVKHKEGTRDPKPKKMAKSILNNYVREYTSTDPALAAKVKKSPKARKALEKKIISKHSKG